MKMMKGLFFILLWLLMSPLAEATSVEEGTQAMKNKEYAKAIKIYDGLVSEGQVSGELYYNLGVAHAELGNIGSALFNFHRASKTGLTTDDLLQNMQLVSEQRTDEIEVIPEFFLTRLWDVWRHLLSSNLWGVLSLVFIVGGIYGLFQWRTAKERGSRKMGFTYGIPLVLIAIILALTSRSAAKDRLVPDQGILLSKSIDLRSAPDAESAAILTIHEGADVDVQDRIGTWIKVRLLNGQEGWLPETEVGLF